MVVPPDNGRAEASCAAEHASAQRVSAQRAAAECTAQRAASPSSATDEINYQVSDSGCVVTVCDTGAASLSPQNTDREGQRLQRPPLPMSLANFTSLAQNST